MNRMWEIRDSEEMPYKRATENSEIEAYECGFEEGYQEALREISHKYYGSRIPRMRGGR